MTSQRIPAVLHAPDIELGALRRAIQLEYAEVADQRLSVRVLGYAATGRSSDRSAGTGVRV